MLRIISYSEKTHFEEISSWWKAAGEQPPTRAMMPEESTFVLEAKGKPWIAVTVYLTNSPEVAWVDNLAANPKLPKGAARKAAVAWLQKFLEKWALNLGYRKLFCMAAKPALAKKYRDLGYTSTLKNVETFIKLLGEPSSPKTLGE